VVTRLDRLFNDHPHAVGETYGEHLAMAATFAGHMFLGALACLAHGLAPFLFQSTGSRQIRRLHAAMVADRSHAAQILAARPWPAETHPAG
jgi:hypothetical protein